MDATLQAITSLHNTIRRAGFHVSSSAIPDRKARTLKAVADATNVETGESWSVTAPTELEALVELGEQIGVELDG